MGNGSQDYDTDIADVARELPLRRRRDLHRHLGSGPTCTVPPRGTLLNGR